MAELVFDLAAQLGKGSLMTLRDEKGVVAKSALTRSGFGDGSFANAFKPLHRVWTRGFHKRKDAAETGSALGGGVSFEQL